MEEKEVTFRKEVDIIITTQAQRVIRSSKYTLHDFKEWALKDQRISLGGNNATIFLEAMAIKEMDVAERHEK